MGDWAAVLSLPPAATSLTLDTLSLICPVSFITQQTLSHESLMDPEPHSLGTSELG